MLSVIDLHWDYDGELESCLIEGTSKNDYGDTERGIYVPITECELMQFTGLFDATNKPIFEGDVIQCAEDYKRLDGRTIIKGVYTISSLFGWCDAGLFRYEGWWSLTDFPITMFDGNNKIMEIEIIGNIYENKELLK